MRVHPTSVTKKMGNWQTMAAAGVIIVLLILNLARPSSAPLREAPPEEKKIEVLVARESIEAGAPLEGLNIVLEQRPVNTLPSDVVSSFDVIKGKVAAGPIPMGYPLALALLADPVAVIPVADDGKAQEEPESPVEVLLKEIEKNTVAMPVSFAADSPVRGTRVAVTLVKGRGDSELILEEAWVSRGQGREAVLRVNPAQALLLQAARSYGQLGFIELPVEGPSPYAGKGVADEMELRKRIDGEAAAQAAQVAPKRLKGYAWVPGEGVRYGLEEDGSIRIVGDGH